MRIFTNWDKWIQKAGWEMQISSVLLLFLFRYAPSYLMSIPSAQKVRIFSMLILSLNLTIYLLPPLWNRKHVKVDNSRCVGRTELTELSLAGIKEVNKVLYSSMCQFNCDNIISNSETAFVCWLLNGLMGTDFYWFNRCTFFWNIRLTWGLIHTIGCKLGFLWW